MSRMFIMDKFFFFNDTATTEIYTLSLHDALPITLADFGPGPAGWREGVRFESAANWVLQGAPVDCLCLYDRRRLPAVVVETAAATHPHLVHDGAWAPSTAYRDPADYLPGLPWPREPVEDSAPVLALDDAPKIGRAHV